MIARIKLLLGFYQVIGEIFTSLHDIKWTGPLITVGKFISAFEMNIVRLFVRPRCFNVKLDLNPKMQFVIGVVSPLVIVFVPFLLYQSRKFYVYIRFTPGVRISLQSHFKKLKSSIVACVVVLLFIIYPPVCSVIFRLYPVSCKTFTLDENKLHNITRLRSDYDVDCAGLMVYHISAFILTILYVVAFPALLLYLLFKNKSRFHNKESWLDDRTLNQDYHRNNLLTTGNFDQKRPPIWLHFLSENYKGQFWFWEIVKLGRKVTQTLLITLYGWENRMTVLLTTFMSVLFLLLHATYRPMKSSYEQSLQMFSLTVIFLNVVVAANDFPDEHDGAISTVLVLLNIVILVMIAGEFVVTMVMHAKHLRFGVTLVAAVSRLKRQGKPQGE